MFQSVSRRNWGASASEGYMFKVQFKRLHRYFSLKSSEARDIKVGDFVKVEADRGEDLGVVCMKIAYSDFREEKPTAGFRGRGFSAEEDDKKILRCATESEKVQLPSKLSEETKALLVCQEKVFLRRFLMKVVDAEVVLHSESPHPYQIASTLLLFLVILLLSSLLLHPTAGILTC